MNSPQDPRDPNSGAYPPPGQQPPAGDSAYGGYMPMAQSNDGPQRLVRPKEVNISFWLWVAGAVVSVVSAILLLTQLDAIEAAARQQSQLEPSEISADQVATVVVTGVYFLIALTVIAAALFVFFAAKARQGRNWARITLTVLIVLYALLTLFGVAGSVATGSAAGTNIVGYVIALLGVIATVLLYLPASNAYFNNVKRRG